MISPIFVLDTFKLSSQGVHHKPIHLQRTIDCLKMLNSPILKDEIIHLYDGFKPSEQDYKIRLQIDPYGLKKTLIKKSTIEQIPQKITLEIASIKNQLKGLGLQNYKTNQRAYWDKNLSQKSDKAFDIIGVNTDGYITETSRFNLFLEKDGRLFTPPLSSGCINGCLRQSLFNDLTEKDFKISDLHQYKILVGNSLRGLIPAEILS